MTEETAMEGLVTAAAVADLMGVPVGTIHQLVHQKRIPHIRLGRRFIRFRRSEVVAWLARHAVTPEGGR